MINYLTIHIPQILHDDTEQMSVKKILSEELRRFVADYRQMGELLH